MKLRKVKKPKVKKVSLKTARNKAWKVFSEYIRRKYAITNGNVYCCTCNWVGPWQESQAGHFVDGRNNSVLYDERLIHVQCVRCNVFLKGNKVVYTVFMMKKYLLTIDQIKEFDELKHKSRPMKAFEHLEIYDKYKKLLESL